ncbi:hypothetical protein [Bizionia arctica]|uniref:Uncharacterized protein n=1 Tax=Bizionia arctica TaxID=1495645 RepID=A0A917GFF2_9FLAO|nr:hypothetical protein [Bizionia arctica]GGG42891.1 hypothetical protein GCM10010976_12980 [Bizionia arctica]
MILTKSNILIASIIALCISFALFQFQDEYFISSMSKSLIVPLFTLLYFINVKNKSPYFTWFLLLFSFSELINFISFYLDTDEALDLFYLAGNSIYIIAYILLLFEVLKGLKMSKVIKDYKHHLLILGLLNIYIVYVLLTIVYPAFSNTDLVYIELLYNVVMLLLLSFSLIGYFYNDNKKALLFFLGTLCIVFSEFIQIAYFYIIDTDMLNFASTLLFVLAFCFYYFYSRVRNEKTFKLFN